jgi:hypothetical protein
LLTPLVVVAVFGGAGACSGGEPAVTDASAPATTVSARAGFLDDKPAPDVHTQADSDDPSGSALATTPSSGGPSTAKRANAASAAFCVSALRVVKEGPKAAAVNDQAALEEFRVRFKGDLDTMLAEAPPALRPDVERFVAFLRGVQAPVSLAPVEANDAVSAVLDWVGRNCT